MGGTRTLPMGGRCGVGVALYTGRVDVNTNDCFGGSSLKGKATSNPYMDVSVDCRFDSCLSQYEWR